MIIGKILVESNTDIKHKGELYKEHIYYLLIPFVMAYELLRLQTH